MPDELVRHLPCLELHKLRRCPRALARPSLETLERIKKVVVLYASSGSRSASAPLPGDHRHVQGHWHGTVDGLVQANVVSEMIRRRARRCSLAQM